MQGLRASAGKGFSPVRSNAPSVYHKPAGRGSWSTNVLRTLSICSSLSRPSALSKKGAKETRREDQEIF